MFLCVQQCTGKRKQCKHRPLCMWFYNNWLLMTLPVAFNKPTCMRFQGTEEISKMHFSSVSFIGLSLTNHVKVCKTGKKKVTFTFFFIYYCQVYFYCKENALFYFIIFLFFQHNKNTRHEGGWRPQKNNKSAPYL
jgi:hypothetical protein